MKNNYCTELKQDMSALCNYMHVMSLLHQTVDSKKAAVMQQDFERAAKLRDEEKKIQRDLYEAAQKLPAIVEKYKTV